VVFVTGDPGRGKTALIQAFARRAIEAHPDLLVAVGSGNAYTGLGDPYLPFREILGLLTGDVEARWEAGAISREQALRLWHATPRSAQALADCGPDLVNTFISGAALVARAHAYAPVGADWLARLEQLEERRTADSDAAKAQQSDLFEQYTRVLQTLARQGPLLLAVDDLQWADAGSISLLFHLSRGVPGHRILILGAYRPEEVALGRDVPASGLPVPLPSRPVQDGAAQVQVGQSERHPLEPVVNELKRSFGDIEVDLTQAEDREFVDAFLDTEANRLDVQFREMLYRQTKGHALYTIELLRGMQERGDLIKDESGRWVEGQTLDWERLPARVEAVIAERIGRLPAEWQTILATASVEGEEFTAEVVAQAGATDAQEIIRCLSGELSKQHRLVVAHSLQRLDGQRLSRYRFRHRLFQTYLYQSLDEVERVHLHEAVGDALETLYGEGVADIPVRLARHFQAAGLTAKAANYLFQAGKRASRMSANQEAITHFSRALDLTPAGDLSTRYALTLVREKVHDLRGEREAQRQDLAALESLVEALDDIQKRVEVTLRQARYAEVTSDYPAAIAAAQRAIRLSSRAGDAQGEATGYLMWGNALSRQGVYEAARSQLEHALTGARAADLARLEAECLLTLGIVSQRQDDYAGAKVYDEQALGISRGIGDRRGEAQALNNLGIASRSQGDYAGAKVYWEQALRVFQEIGDRRGEDTTLNNLGIVCEIEGDYSGAITYSEQSLRICREIGDRRGEARALNNLGVTSDSQGDYVAAKVHHERALRISREIGSRLQEGITLASLSLLSHHLGDDRAAQEYGQQALLIMRELGNPDFEGYTLTDLGHALAGLGRLAESADAYRSALALRRELGQHNLAMEPLAGLARISLAQGDLSQAQAQVEEILSHLQMDAPLVGSGQGLIGAEEPFRVYLTCYRFLKASQDPRAEDVLRTAHRLLDERAARIGDEELRRSFLENVAAHREILSAVTQDIGLG
jgi:tetratricopeptide (TPR) repeat protein